MRVIERYDIDGRFEETREGDFVWYADHIDRIAQLEADLAEALAPASVNEQSQAQQSQWISVEERLPEENTYVLCSYKRFGEWLVHEGRYNEKGDFTITIIDAKVRYWMPLPPAPMSDNEQSMNEVNKPEGEKT